MSEKVSNNITNYDGASNYRSYYRKITYEAFDNSLMLGIPELPTELPVGPNDKKYKIKKSEEGRLDIIAKKFYGDEYLDFMWIIMIYNDIFDPYQEITAETELYIPSRETLTSILA